MVASIRITPPQRTLTSQRAWAMPRRMRSSVLQFCLRPVYARCLGGVTLLLAVVANADGLDWPCFHGPDHNNRSRETNWFQGWPGEGPKRLWKASVGGGFSSVSVANGRLYTQGLVNGQETVWCLEAATGLEKWKHSYPYGFKPQYYEGGTSATPTAEGDAVYTVAQNGLVNCFEAGSGRVRWSKHLAKDYGFAVPTWGFASSAYLEGDLLILNAGQAGAALNKTTGALVWQNGQGPAGYSTAVPFLFKGTRGVALFGAKEVVGLSVKTGEALWRFPWKTEYDVNAADPVLWEGSAFVASSYGSGCALMRFEFEPVREVWRRKDFESHFNSAILHEGYLYGVHGEAGKPAAFKCLEWKTGEVKWSEPGLGMGGCTLAEGKLIILSEKGELLIVPASPSGFKPLARAQVLGGKCWTVPVLCQGRIYCRNSTGDLVAVSARSQ